MRTLEAAPKTSKVQMFGRILLGLMLVYTGRVASHVRASGISGAGPAVDSFETRSRRLSLGLPRDHAWVVPTGLISVQSVRGTDGGALFCGGLPRQHRSIYRAPRCVWPEHRYGAARPSLLSAPSCCLGALVYGRLAICYWFMAAVCRKRYCENGALEVADEECPYAQRGWR